MTALDYASVYENEYRPSRRVRRALARVLWVGLLVVRPSLALQVLRDVSGRG
jgi:hypothetical protein